MEGLEDAKIKIQVVEDEGVVALDICRHLESFGYAVSGTHASGESAIGAFEKESPGLVLMDIRLQGELDGIDAARIIRERYNVPVILLTAYADEKTVERAKGIEPFGYIIKPFEERELRTNIEMALFRHNLETMLQKSEERYRSFFQDDLSADFVADAEGRLLDCNRSFIEYFKFENLEAALGTKLKDRFLNEEDALLFWRELRKHGRLELHELELVKTEGSTINLLANVVADLDKDGVFREVKGYLIDISRRKDLEKQLRQAQKLEAVGRLAGGVAHDFNNILTVILGYSTILREKLSSSNMNMESDIRGIEEAAQRASSLTRQLLAFSRRQILKPSQVHVNVLIRNLDKMLSRLITEDITMRFDLKADPETVWVDAGQLEQVLINLIVNARDAISQGGSIWVETCNTQVENPIASPMGEIPPGEYVCISVKDNGEGIEPQYLKMIFEPFFTTKEEEKGTGLGLSTVYGIVKQSNGYICLESVPGSGTSFFIYLPLYKQKHAAEKKTFNSAGDLKGDETVLVVEDETSLRLLTLRILKLYGYNVSTADRPSEALKILRETREKIDLMISDIVMPEMGGLELADRVRSLYPEIKVLFMSGYPQKMSKTADGRGTGAEKFFFIPKPFTPEELASEVRKVLDLED
jgi:PAS domain S-box-containing protein